MVRKATLKDVSDIYILIKIEATKGKVLPRSKDELKKVISCFYVYNENNTILGCCSLEIYNRKLAEIRSLVVSPNHQRRSIGTKLVKACLKEAQAKNIYEVLAITDKDAFFERIGFSKCLNGQYPMFLRCGK